MSTCLRICGAYFYRLSRRHSTLLLIASFIVTITIILQLYSYRNQNRPSHSHPQVGDFDYRPGSFLKGRQPNENTSFCEFNYGLPDALKWDNLHVDWSPEMGSRGPYRVIYNAIIGTAYTRYGKYNAVTYVTQATPEYVYHVVEIARYWDGPISLAVFVPDYDLDITMQIMKHLCHCYEGMSKVSVHLFYPRKCPPKIGPKDRNVTVIEIPTTPPNITAKQVLKNKIEAYKNLNRSNRDFYVQWVRKRKLERMTVRMSSNRLDPPNLVFEDCSGLESFDMSTFRREHSLIYLINVGRNVARNASTTNYFIMSDIEMVPSDKLAPKFLAMVRKLMGDKKRDEGFVFAKTVFVVPLFEVEKGEDIPHDKQTLVQMVVEKRARYFHQKICVYCQRFPGLQSWLMKPAPDNVEPLLIAKREYPYHRWEPLYFGTNKEPWYNEMLSWEGRQDKMTQMLELCLQEYRIVVLDGGFLCHAAAPKRSVVQKAQRINAQRYLKIIGTLKQKYPDRPQCKINWGQPMMDWWGAIKNTFV